MLFVKHISDMRCETNDNLTRWEESRFISKGRTPQTNRIELSHQFEQKRNRYAPFRSPLRWIKEERRRGKQQGEGWTAALHRAAVGFAPSWWTLWMGERSCNPWEGRWWSWATATQGSASAARRVAARGWGEEKEEATLTRQKKCVFDMGQICRPTSHKFFY